MHPGNRLSRRSFLATAAATVAVPTIIPSKAFGANERVVLGHIGLGGQGMAHLKALTDHTAAVCDVDRDHLAAAAKVVEQAGGKFQTYSDYRRLLDRKDIDAVLIATPDHWHALPTIHACQAGKDVFCEKPLTVAVAEGRAMVEAARKHKRIVQTGSQQRYAKNFRLACELVRSGKIGKVTSVLVGLPASNFSGPPVPDSSAPAVLDYDFWLGPAPDRPYNEKRVHYNFRFFWDYSGGQMTNWGAHHIDIAQWGLGMDDSGPTSVEGTATFHPEHWFEVPVTSRLTHTYANGVTLIVGQLQDDVPFGTTFIGTEGKIFVGRGKLSSTPSEIIRTPLKDDDVHLYVSDDHVQNFFSCVKSRELPICDVEIGHRSATVCHLGNIVLRLGRKVQWDPASERIIGDDQANAMLSRPYRAPWTI